MMPRASWWIGLVVAALCGCERRQPAAAPSAVRTEGESLRISYVRAPRIVIEAEDGVVTAPMAVFEDAHCGGGKYVLAPEGPDHKEISIGGDVAHRIKIDEAGEYSLWFRVRFSGPCGNSLGVFLDGEEVGTVEDAVFDQWHWVPLQGRRITLSAGEHQLVVANREDGAACDQIALTTDPDWRPVAIEVAAGGSGR